MNRVKESKEMPDQKINIWIASDHAGIETKEKIMEKFPQFSWHDLGPEAPENKPSNYSVDYPDYAQKVGHEVVKANNAETDLGVLICGTGIGMSISANKIKGIRAALVKDEQTAKLSREHNHANILCLGARVTDEEKLLNCVKVLILNYFLFITHSLLKGALK